MDVHRLIDLWQVVLQEPRVAVKGEHLILQSEISQQLAREVLAKQNRNKKKAVQKSQESDKQSHIIGERQKQSHSAPAVPKVKKRLPQAQSYKNSITKDHVDIRV
jgi:hypothetical protein